MSAECFCSCGLAGGCRPHVVRVENNTMWKSLSWEDSLLVLWSARTYSIALTLKWIVVFDLDCRRNVPSTAHAQWPVKRLSLCRSRACRAPARSSAGQQRHIKPGKLHQGNKMAIKWQQQYINPSPGSAEGTVKSSSCSWEWFLGFISSAAAALIQEARGQWGAEESWTAPSQADWAHINIAVCNKKMH